MFRTEEQELLAESVKEFCNRNISEAKIKDWYANHNVSDEVCKAWADSGFGLMGLPEEYGGVEASVLDRMILSEELCKNSGCLVPMAGWALPMWDIIEFGRPDQINYFLDIYKKTGRLDLAFCISEPTSGTDNAGGKTTVKNVNGKLLLNGSKCYVSSARNCNHLIVIAKDEDPSRENKNFTLWLMPKSLPGISEVPLEELGCGHMPFSDVFFDDVELDESMMFGPRGKGFICLMKNFEVERTILPAASLGLAQAAMNEAAAYCSERKVFEKNIGEYQLIQKKLCDMEVKIMNMRNLVYQVASEIDMKVPGVNTHCALLKYYCGRAAFEVCDDALYIFASIGYSGGHKIGRIWAEAKGYEFAGGTAEVMVHIAGRQLVKKYARR